MSGDDRPFPDLADPWGDGDFKPHVSYQGAMDWLMVILEDVSYRAQPLGPVDVLWHPHEDRIVGIKLRDATGFPGGAGIVAKAGLS